MDKNMNFDEDTIDGTIACKSSLAPNSNGLIKNETNGNCKSRNMFSRTPNPKDRDSCMMSSGTGGHVNVSSAISLTAKDLSLDLVYHFCQPNRRRKAPSRHAETLRRTVHEMVEKHEIVFKGMIKKLDIQPENIEGLYYNVAREMFGDGQINWGRIVSLYTLGAILAKHITNQSGFDKDFLDDVADIVASYVSDNHGRWISDQGGWDNFVEIFTKPQTVESVMWRGLLFTAVGLGALATLVVAR